jgi:hypothetical protein
LMAGELRGDEPGSLAKIGIITIEGGDPLELFDVRPALPLKMRWSADGRTLFYVANRDGVSNIWSYPLDGGAPKQITDFKSDQIFYFDWSRDGKQLVLSRGMESRDVVLISDFK